MLVSNADRNISKSDFRTFVGRTCVGRACAGRACAWLLVPAALVCVLQWPSHASAAPAAQAVDASAAACNKAEAAEVTIKSVNIHQEISLTDGRLLQLAGIVAPRGTKAWPDLPEMARIAMAGWIRGQTLQVHIRQGPADRWGRNLARLVAPDSARPPQLRSVAANMIESGWALVKPATAEPVCLGYFYKLEEAARTNKLGLWSDAFYRVFRGREPEGLASRAGQAVIVEGVVLSVRRWRSLTFFNFGRRRRDNVSVLMSKRARSRFERAKKAPESFKGRRIRIRGVLEMRGGPRLRAYNPHFIEILN